MSVKLWVGAVGESFGETLSGDTDGGAGCRGVGLGAVDEGSGATAVVSDGTGYVDLMCGCSTSFSDPLVLATSGSTVALAPLRGLGAVVRGHAAAGGRAA